MTTALVSEEVTAYIAAVREALADLPVAERDDLLAEVESSLLDAAADDGSIAERLGPPERFAAELRAAAGLQAPHAAPATSRTRGAWARLRAAAERLASHPRADGVRHLAGELAPVWWVARAYAAVVVYAQLTDAGWVIGLPVVPHFSTGGFSALVMLAAIAASVWLGLRARRTGTRASRVAVAANFALGIATLSAAAHGLDVARGSYLPPQTEGYVHYEATPRTAFNDAMLDNIYPYDRDGKLLYDVLLYDSAGMPLNVEAGDPDRRLLFSRTGEPILNAFPIRYFEPGTRRVADTEAGPKVKPPRVVTPPLKRTR